MPTTSQKQMPMIQVTLKRSMIGCNERQRATVRGLGLRRLNHTVAVQDTPANRGMINKVYPFLKIEENLS